MPINAFRHVQQENTQIQQQIIVISVILIVHNVVVQLIINVFHAVVLDI